MTLPSRGVMKASMIRSELRASGKFDINASNYRRLAGRTSGRIRFSDFYGKANTFVMTSPKRAAAITPASVNLGVTGSGFSPAFGSGPHSIGFLSSGVIYSGPAGNGATATITAIANKDLKVQLTVPAGMPTPRTVKLHFNVGGKTATISVANGGLISFTTFSAAVTSAGIGTSSHRVRLNAHGDWGTVKSTEITQYGVGGDHNIWLTL